MPCLDENQVLQYVGGFLSAAEEQVIDGHLATCDECRALVSAGGVAALDELDSWDDLTRTASASFAAGSSPVLLEGRVKKEVHKDTYVLERLIGRGGFGVVYEASHLRLERRFAIKFLYRRWAANAEAVARMKREAEITSRLSHPNIVEIVDFNYSDDGTPFIVMELLQGESLAERLKRVGTISDLAEVAGTILPVIAALTAAHEKGIVHRDLKPSNIFLCRGPEAQEIVKVVDFGIAKISAPVRATGRKRPAEEITRIRSVIGTPKYMSPEQALGRSSEVDRRADIFALGAILFRMLSGVAPFEGATAEETMDRVARGQPLENDRWRAVPRTQREAILRALSKDPDKRQQSARQLGEELSLSSFVEGPRATISATENVHRRPGKGLPHHRRLLLATLLATVAVGAVASYVAVSRRDRVPQKAPVVARAAPDALAADGSLGAIRVPEARRDAAATHAANDGLVRGPSVEARRPPSRSARSSPRHSRHLAGPRAWGSMIIQSKLKETGQYLWAEVFLDGKHVGQTAMTLEKVSEGLHKVEVRRAGYLSSLRRARVRPGKKTVVRFELERAGPAQ